MGNSGLDTGCFDEDGRWRKYKEAQNYRSGPSPWPLLILVLLIAMVMLLRGGGEVRTDSSGMGYSAMKEGR